jgi:hypothetical protein
MRLPTKLVIGPFEYTIKLKNHIEVDGNGCYGSHDARKQVIRLRRKNTDDRMRETLMHEVLHALSCRDGLGLDEETVQTLGTGLAEVLVNNPVMTRMYAEACDEPADSGD